jgi:hypothetical protein
VGTLGRGWGDTPHAYTDAAYIAVIGLSGQFRSSDPDDPWKTKAGERLGDYLMSDALRFVKREWRGGMPWCLTLVDPTNDPSRTLFERHDFVLFIQLGDALYRRPKNRRLPP